MNSDDSYNSYGSYSSFSYGDSIEDYYTNNSHNPNLHSRINSEASINSQQVNPKFIQNSQISLSTQLPIISEDSIDLQQINPQSIRDSQLSLNLQSRINSQISIDSEAFCENQQPEIKYLAEASETDSSDESTSSDSSS